jgi:ribonuclease HI
MSYKIVNDKYWATINVDSSFDHNTNQGGYGIWITTPNKRIKKWGKFKTELLDSNHAELLGTLNALHILKEERLDIRAIGINCDNDLVRKYIKKRCSVNEKYEICFNKLHEYLLDYEGSFAMKIRGHSSESKPRDFVNKWCDKMSREYKRGNKK